MNMEPLLPLTVLKLLACDLLQAEFDLTAIDMYMVGTRTFLPFHRYPGTMLMQVDALLGERGGSMEHETSRNMKTEFMQLWDGLLKCRKVLVVAATNQPDRLPDAIWRRFSSHFEVRNIALLLRNGPAHLTSSDEA